jgi:dienelactone hydrolase
MTSDPVSQGRPHPKISKENIFLLGLSDGANAALLSAKGGSIGQFRAIAAYYPDCERLLAGVGYVYKSPTIVLVGEKDDWTPPAECIKSKSPGVVTGAEFDVTSYANAHHPFRGGRSNVALLNTGLQLGLV